LSTTPSSNWEFSAFSLDGLMGECQNPRVQPSPVLATNFLATWGSLRLSTIVKFSLMFRLLTLVEVQT
jgi:hypothetical protein